MIPKYQVGRCWGCGCELVIGGQVTARVDQSCCQVARRAAGNCPSFENVEDKDAAAERERLMERKQLVKYLNSCIGIIRTMADGYVQIFDTIDPPGTSVSKRLAELAVLLAELAVLPSRAVCDDIERYLACLATPTKGAGDEGTDG